MPRTRWAVLGLRNESKREIRRPAKGHCRGALPESSATRPDVGVLSLLCQSLRNCLSGLPSSPRRATTTNKDIRKKPPLSDPAHIIEGRKPVHLGQNQRTDGLNRFNGGSEGNP